MDKVRPILENVLPEGVVVSGTVTATLDDAPYCTVAVHVQKRRLEVLATRAAGFADGIAQGDRVLCVSGEEGEVYITMLLRKADSAARVEDANEQNNRAVARAVSRNGSRLYEVRDKRGELIFEYDPENDRSRVVVTSGTLDVNAPEGDIRFSARGRVQIHGSIVELCTSGLPGMERSRFSLGPYRTGLQSASLDIRTGKGRIEMAEANYSGKRLESRVARARLNWGRLESLVDSLIQKARTSFTTVEELSQTKAGRMRTLVAGSFRMKAERAKLKTEKNFDIDGERINLG